ncbi:MAG: response regulator transcription factor [Micropepsaceae bacterium]
MLLGENQRQFGLQLRQRLRAQCEVDFARDVPNLNSFLLQRAYGLVILAMDVPKEDRIKLIELCKQFSQKTAIMIVTDPAPVHERVQALEAGADDVLMRPVHLDELVARARALMRRADASLLAKIRVGNLELADDGEIYFHGARAVLQQAEQKVLSILVRRAGRLVTKSMIDRAVTGVDSEELSSNAIEQRMSRLRRILDTSNTNVQINTIRGSGYILEARPLHSRVNEDHEDQEATEMRVHGA